VRVDLLEDAGGDGARVARVGVEGLDDLLDGDGGLSDAPGVVVGRRADERVAGVSKEPGWRTAAQEDGVAVGGWPLAEPSLG
jgi:hypothetical protein